jgi:hypothetical protein
MPRPVDRAHHIALRLIRHADELDALMAGGSVEIDGVGDEFTPEEIAEGLAFARIALAILPARMRERAVEIEARPENSLSLQAGN